MTQKKESLRGRTLEEIRAVVTAYGEPAYRAQQIREALFHPGYRSWNDCRVLPLPLRELLIRDYPFTSLTIDRIYRSSDDTVKYVFMTGDGQRVETVFIPQNNRRTVCLSTQVGCKYSCSFCMSGSRGFIRDLTAAEIVDQVYGVSHETGERVTNVVFMGMGEPFDNYEAFIRALRTIQDEKGYGIGARHITVSTVGIAGGIERFAREGLDQIKLAVSLHAVDDVTRSHLMPANWQYPLTLLLDTLKKNRSAFKRAITFEYVLLNGLNDAPENARTLARYAHEIRAKINLIWYNATPATAAAGLAPSSPEAAQAFEAVLKECGALYTVRHSGGADIAAACGQLSCGENDI